MNIGTIGDCSDLYENAAEELKRLDHDIDKTIQDLANKVEARGVPKNKVARQVVKELTARRVLSPTRIYEGPGIEYKRKYVNGVIEETFPQVENIPTEESSTNIQAVEVVTTSTGHPEALTGMNKRPDVISDEERAKRQSLQLEEANEVYDRLSYDELLRLAAGTARKMIPLLCRALKRENPNYSNHDIREIIEKDCIHIWQKATIRDAFEDEYKDKQKQEAGRIGSEVRYGSGQSAEYCNSGDMEQDSARKNLAENVPVGPVEDVFEDFSQMNRGTEVITEKERAKMLSKQLEEAESERSLLRHEIDDLKNQVRVLSEKNTPELLKEIEERFADDQKGVLDAKKLQKISMEAGKNLVILVGRYNSILQEAVERGKPVPFGTYILTKPELKLVPVRILVDFNRKRICVELWEKRLQSLSR